MTPHAQYDQVGRRIVAPVAIFMMYVEHLFVGRVVALLAVCAVTLERIGAIGRVPICVERWPEHASFLRRIFAAAIAKMEAGFAACESPDQALRLCAAKCALYIDSLSSFGKRAAAVLSNTLKRAELAASPVDFRLEGVKSSPASAMAAN